MIYTYILIYYYIILYLCYIYTYGIKSIPLPCLASLSTRSRYLASLLPPAPGTWPVSLLRGWGCCYFENLTPKPFGSAGWQVTGP